MRNKIDILRAICFSKEDIANIKNLGDEFTELEIEFMEQFKKVFEFGESELKIFIDKLDEEGKDLEVWDIEYYVKHLQNSPLGAMTRELAVDKKYFPIIPDILGITGNNQTSRHNTTLYDDDVYPSGVSVDTFNKSPEFVQKMLRSSNELVEKVFRSSVNMMMFYDNTLPLADKAPNLRYQEEKLGLWTSRSNGSYGVKDSTYRLSMEDIRSEIFDKVKELVGEENYRGFIERKNYNPFGEDNTATSKVYEIEKKFVQGDNELVKTLDIMGDEFTD